MAKVRSGEPHTVDVEHDRRREKVSDLGWTTEEERRGFSGSANHPGVSGVLARHARPDSPKLPKNSMTLAEARAWTFRVVDTWLRTLATEHRLELTRPVRGDRQA